MDDSMSRNTLGFVLKEVIHLGGGPVERTDSKALVVHIHDEILSL